MNLRFRRSAEGGAVYIEFLLSVMVFMLILLFAIDLARIGLSQVKLELALRRACLWGSFGRIEAPALTRIQSINNRVIRESRQFGIPVVDANIRVCPGYLFNCASASQSAGSPGEFFTVSVIDQPLHVIFPTFWWRMMSLRGITARATIQNEYVF